MDSAFYVRYFYTTSHDPMSKGDKPDDRIVPVTDDLGSLDFGVYF
jgi:hypothetical protein